MGSAAAATMQRVRHSVGRPYPVPPQMVLLLAIVPIYLFLPGKFSWQIMHAPALALDRAIPLVPAWSLIYGALYAFLIISPVFVVREPKHARRMFSAYLAVWLIAYIFFFLYPTRAPRPPVVVGEGFAFWGLRFLYDSDPPYNCLPSIHVAHSFVSALAAYGVHKGVGVFMTFCAALVALSVLFTKQHYVLDIVGGVFLAIVTYFIFLRHSPRNEVPEEDQRLAPILAASVFAVAVGGIVVAWIAYQFQHLL